MNQVAAPDAPQRETSILPWIAATVIGLIAAAALWVPPSPPEPWASIIGWLIVIGAAVISAALVFVLGARGKTVALAAVMAVVVTALAWPVIVGVLVVIGLFIEAV
jgi:hypothetical protein